MNTHFKFVMMTCLLGISTAAWCQNEVELHRLPISVYMDKMQGAWAGQMIGVSYGSIYEFKWLGEPYTGEIRAWEPDFVSNTIQQDDLYVEMTFLQAMEKYGIGITSEQAGEAFGDSKYDLWHANLWARNNIRCGIPAPKSGQPLYNMHCDDIDFQIEADFCGILSPGMPQTSNDLCDRFGHVMNYGDGVYGGMFVGGMYAAAYFEDDFEKVFLAGLACIPQESEYAQVLQLVYECYQENANDWLACWKAVENRWGNDDTCPEGKDKPFNIDAKLNGAYIAMGILFGQGDFEKTMEISTRCGQDADCNPSNAAGVLGTILGYGGIPERFKAGIPAIADEKFSYTDYNFSDLGETCLKLTKQLTEAAGGKVDGEGDEEALLIPLQEPVPPSELEQYTDAMQKELVEAQLKHLEFLQKKLNP